MFSFSQDCLNTNVPSILLSTLVILVELVVDNYKQKLILRGWINNHLTLSEDRTLQQPAPEAKPQPQ